MQYKIADGINAEMIDQIISIDDIASRLGHFIIAKQHPGMTEDLLGQRKAQSQQHDRPVNGMEADNVLANQVQISRPVFLKPFGTVAVSVIAQPGYIVAQSINPDIDHMPVIKIHRNAPLKGSPRDTKVLQARLQKVIQHFIFA